MINILFIHQSAEMYGSDKTLLLLLKTLNKNCFLPVVILPNEGPLKTELEKQNVKVVIAPVLKIYRKMFSPKNIIKFLLDIKKSFSIIDDLNKEYHFDLIYSNTLAVLLGALYSKKRKIKHLWHVHEIIVHPKIIASIFPKLLNKFGNIVVCNSKATKENLILRNKNLKNKSIIIYNGTEINKYQDSISTKTDFGFKDTDIIITLIGRISRLKGHKWLLSTFINNFIENQDLKLLFVGSPVLGQENYLEEINKVIVNNNLSKKVKILEFTNDLNNIWQITDIAVMPSTEAESFGLVAVEAMLARKPVIASNHGGLTEIVVNDETGFLVEPNNEIELSNAIKKLIDNPGLRKSFGENGYQLATNKFSVETYVTSFEKLFNEIIIK